MANRWKVSGSCVGRVLLGLAAVLAMVAPAAAQTAVDRPVTYSKDIAPILQRSCQRCHRPDSVAPMSLLTYEQVRPYARAIKQRTALARDPWGRGSMPPWFYEKNIGIQKLKDDVSLSDEELALIAKWVDNGAPEGDPKDLPPPLVFADAATWTLGKPDLIVSSPDIIVPEIASDWAANYGAKPTGLTEDRYIQSVEYKEVSQFTSGQKPAGTGTIGNLYAIHHTAIGIREPGEDSQPPNGEAPNVGPSLGGAHEVGRNGNVFPSEAGVLLKKGSSIEFRTMHIHAIGLPGGERKARLDVGLRFHPKGYQPKYSWQTYGFGLSEYEILGGDSNQRFDAYFVAPGPMKLLNFEPHMHATGVRMCLEAIYGRITETLGCSGYDHNWVRNYQFQDDHMPLVPKGTIIHGISWYDNTAKNQNVLDPRNIGIMGNSSVQNMNMIFNQAVFLTDEEYRAEVAQRREFLARTGEEPIGCPACFVQPGNNEPSSR